MSSAPDNSALLPWPAADILTALHGAAEQLFRATDAASVLEICESTLIPLGIAGRLGWRAADDGGTAADTERLDLAEDPQGLRTLALETAPAALTESRRERITWLGRLAAARLRQLAETGRLYEAISRLPWPNACSARCMRSPSRLAPCTT